MGRIRNCLNGKWTVYDWRDAIESWAEVIFASVLGVFGIGTDNTTSLVIAWFNIVPYMKHCRTKYRCYSPGDR